MTSLALGAIATVASAERVNWLPPAATATTSSTLNVSDLDSTLIDTTSPLSADHLADWNGGFTAPAEPGTFDLDGITIGGNLAIVIFEPLGDPVSIGGVSDDALLPVFNGDMSDMDDMYDGLAGRGVAVPLPTPGFLAAVGLVTAMGLRRRRSSI